ncbi:MAG: hypothetical protein WBA57_05785 [Elainellaceae cyanobacterium]
MSRSRNLPLTYLLVFWPDVSLADIELLLTILTPVHHHPSSTIDFIF